MQDTERKLRRLKALRRFREAEQVRLAAELHAHEQRMRLSAEAERAAARFLDGDLALGGLLAGHGLREAARNAAIVDEERRLINDISHRNVQSKAVKDALLELESRLAARVEQQRADAALMETVAAWPVLVRLTGRQV